MGNDELRALALDYSNGLVSKVDYRRRRTFIIDAILSGAEEDNADTTNPDHRRKAAKAAKAAKATKPAKVVVRPRPASSLVNQRPIDAFLESKPDKKSPTLPKLNTAATLRIALPVGLVFLVSSIVYFLLDNSDEPQTIETARQSDEVVEKINPIPTTQKPIVKIVAQEFIDSKIPASDFTPLFRIEWENMSAEQRQSAQKSLWFRQLADYLVARIRYLQNPNGEKNDYKKERQILSELATYLELELPATPATTRIAQKRTTATQTKLTAEKNKNTQTTSKPTTKPLPAANVANAPTKQTTSNAPVAAMATEKPSIGLADTSHLDEPLPAPNYVDRPFVASKHVIKDVLSRTADDDVPAAETELPAKVINKPAKKKPPQPSIKPRQVPTLKLKPSRFEMPSSTSDTTKVNDNELISLVESYQFAYEKGNMEALEKLFASNLKTDANISNLDLYGEYIDTFETSSHRKLDLSKIKWEKSKDQSAVGLGAFIATITQNNNTGIRVVNGNINLEVVKSKGKLKIARLLLLDLKEKIEKPKVNPLLNQSKNRNRPPSGTPTMAELQDLIARFTLAYENGDIENLMSTFAKSARTNDKTDAKGIRKDYENLFAQTSDRQMFIHDLNWDISGRTATADGNIEVMVQGDNQGISQYSGRIRLIAQKTDVGMVITHMFHNTDNE